MLRDELVARIRFKLGNRTDLDDQIIFALQDTQKLYESGIRLPAMLARCSDIAIPSSSGASLPQTFLKLRQLSPIIAIQNNRLVGYPQRVPVALHNAGLNDYGIVYDIVHKTIYGYPLTIPLSFRLYYYAGEPELTSNISNLWIERFPSLLELEVVYKILLFIDEPKLQQAVTSLLALERKAYLDTLWREEYTDLDITFQADSQI